MGTAWIDSDEYDGRGGRSSAKSAMIVVVLLLAFLAAAAGIYWLIGGSSPDPATGPDAVRNETAPVAPVKPGPAPARPATEGSLLKAPPPTCVEGRPTGAGLPADQCI